MLSSEWFDVLFHQLVEFFEAHIVSVFAMLEVHGDSFIEHF